MDTIAVVEASQLATMIGIEAMQVLATSDYTRSAASGYAYPIYHVHRSILASMAATSGCLRQLPLRC